MSVTNKQDNSTRLILPKDIQDNVPYSDKVSSRIFCRLLDDDRVVASYKMYWLLGILDEVSIGHEEIDFERIVARMIVNAWYPILQFKLSFGRFDNLGKPVNYVFKKEKFSTNYDDGKLLDYIIKSKDTELKLMMKELTYNVPYRLLTPFFAEELYGVKDSSKNKMITYLSQDNNNCLYKIIKGEKDKIVLNEGWGQYLKDNYKLIKSWIYFKLVCFIQKRNPNVPAIAFKLEAPRTRKLNNATKLWNQIITNVEIKDIYTGEDFDSVNYKKYGSLSIDHFIPWSFVLHDEMWNLVPTFKNINSKKSDNLLQFESYFNDFCSIQYKAFSYLCDNKIETALEQYIDVMRLDNPYDYSRHSSHENFNSKMRQCIYPLYQIATNQGFQVISKLILN
ncbi:HNH endonuclease [Clostridium swellfunianum]|uniref:HNH endonuclease domain-containing protein n=1 Tax=Clostridium swellfunianum TaxID=1367462 RepID=UPI002030105B|nr:HNH endonuclease domain-containing protein [Clostridium swellfunianum]MCM0647362.1 HNH endonuclease [Clostridium swellfunianum]